MHKTVKEFISSVISEEIIKDKVILEIGSYNINGSVKPDILALQPFSYIGIDARPGPDVDIVADITSVNSLVMLPDVIDVIVCCEMLEHVEKWQEAIENMIIMLNPGGHLLLTTRSPGFKKHDYPNDYWRFTLEDMTKIFSRMIIRKLVSDTQSPGVFIHAQKPLALRDITVQSVD